MKTNKDKLKGILQQKDVQELKMVVVKAIIFSVLIIFVCKFIIG